MVRVMEEAWVVARVRSISASPSTQAANVSPVIRDKARSEGTQPNSQSEANAANTAPGAITTNTSRACEELTPRPLLPSSESRPSGDGRSYPHTIRPKRGQRAGVRADRPALRIRNPAEYIRGR